MLRISAKHCDTVIRIAISAYVPENLYKTYTVSVKAQPPCNGEFKAIVRQTDHGFEMASRSIDRLDRYRKNGNCVDDSLKHLCHCKPTSEPTKTKGRA
ncbi:hypothetical protein COOONC_19228 [Cooperia oncophora]